MHPPVFPIGQMTSGELRAYRKQLQGAISKLGDVPVATELQQKLDLITAEEESRTRIADAAKQNPIDPGHNAHHSA